MKVNFFQFLNKLFICKMQESYVFNNGVNDKQLFRINLKYINCFKLFINDIAVEKKNEFLVSTYKGSNEIKVELKGVFNSEIVFLEVSPKKIDVNIPKFKNVNETQPIGNKYQLKHKIFNFYNPYNQVVTTNRNFAIKKRNPDNFTTKKSNEIEKNDLLSSILIVKEYKKSEILNKYYE